MSALPLRVLGTGVYLPGEAIPNRDWLARSPGLTTAEAIEDVTGILSRHAAGPEESVGSMGAEAAKIALARAGVAPGELARVLLTCSHGGDRRGPATVNTVMDSLGATCGAFDVNNGCHGFLTALDLGARLVATGESPVLIVASELVTRTLLNPLDHRTFPLFGDGAAAVVLGPARGQGALLSSVHRQRGDMLQSLFVPSPQDTLRPEGQIHFAASGRLMRTMVEELLPQVIQAALDEAGLTMAEVDWVAPHQPNAVWLERLITRLNLPSDRVPRVVHRTGNVPSALVPLGLDALFTRADGPKPGDRVLMMAIGAGVAYGAAVLRVD
ncbi:ketoacyl-ACP synthase III [Myxococcota bacterium]|nr:ketoacyl-ACP synthase III [Myxococcota bacterium]